MKRKRKEIEMRTALIVIMSLIVVTIFSTIGWGVNCYNKELVLRKQIEAVQENNKNEFDNMWKKIKQVSNVTDKYKDGFKEVLETYVGGREIDAQNLLVNWTKEAVPNFDSSMYKQLMNVIVASRNTFTQNQKQLIDMKRQHDTLIEKIPDKFIYNLLNVKSIDIQIITSDKTDEIFKTGKDNDINL